MVAILPQINEINELPKSVMDIPSKTYGLHITDLEKQQLPMEVSYIENQWIPYPDGDVVYIYGPQWLDTKVQTQANTRLELIMQLVEFPEDRVEIFGNKDGTMATKLGINICASGGWEVRQGTNTSATQVYPEINTTYFVEGIWTDATCGLKINGTSIYSSNRGNTNFDGETFKLFSMSSSTSRYSLMRVYACKIYTNDTLMRNFIPALDLENIPCFYDTVSNTFFYSNFGNNPKTKFKYGEVVGPLNAGYPVTNIYKDYFYPDTISGKIDNLEAVRQAVYKILMTERYAYLIYSNNYGVELEQYIGKDFNYLKATIEGTLKDALTYDLRIKDVEVTSITKEEDRALIKFNIYSIYGDLQMEVNISV